MKIKELKLVFACALLGFIMMQSADVTGNTFVDGNQKLMVTNNDETTITGIVTDDNGDGLPGVTIMIKGTTIGTTTDVNGNFTINATQEATLVFSSVGFVSEEIEVGNRTRIELTMAPDITALEEIIVVGYGTQKKSDITGAVASVKPDDLKSIPLARVDETLQGQIAGVYVQNNDASPNANITIRVRGVSSINGGNNPLVVVDGIQGLQLNDIHPNDILSIEVLKDASATAIYGSRGASGVILVTTKGGKSNKPTLTYNGYVAVSQVAKHLDLMNAGQYAEYTNENRIARDLPPVFTQEEVDRYKTEGGTDWQDEIFQNGWSHNHHLTVSGGNDNVLYSIAGDYLKTEGVVIGSSYERVSFRPNFTINLSSKLKLSVNSFASWSMDHPTMLNNRDREGSPIYAAALFPPTKPIFNEDGSYAQPGGGVGPNTEYNPVALAMEPIRDNVLDQYVVSPSFDYEIIDGLNLNAGLSYRLLNATNGRYINENIVNGDEKDREASIYSYRESFLQNTNMLTYQKDINDKHSLHITGVYEQQKNIYTDSWAESRDFLTNAVLYNNLALGADPGVPASYRVDRSLQSFLGRINYSYDSRYIITLTGRADASSVFAENNKWGYFPSAALGWNISNEAFFENSKVLTDLKLRASYGRVGNQGIEPYQSLAQLETGTNFSFNGTDVTTGLNLSTRAPNPDLKWETTEQFNVGLDMGFWEGRMSLIVDLYKKNTHDLLLERALVQASGYQSQLVNAGEVENKGVEFTLSGYVIDRGSFQWNTNLNFAYNKNTVLQLNDDEDQVKLFGAGLPGFSEAIWIEKNQPIGLIKGHEFAGVWKSDEALLAAVYGVEPGSPKYIDQNKDGIINGEDIVNIGRTYPEITFGWNNTLTYKNFDLNFLIQGVEGRDLYNIGRSRYESGDHGTSVKLLEAWTEENEDTEVIGHKAYGNIRNDSRWIEDGSYIRLKNLILGYNVPSEVFKSSFISSIRVYASGTNLITLTNYSGYDPEASNSIDAWGGVDHASYPSQKRYTLGLDIRF
ncbi:MAG: TonB-dependent receptor [Cytophagales bacterium]|nr:TonB-dependent receptor [Cytophagales bacterium]